MNPPKKEEFAQHKVIYRVQEQTDSDSYFIGIDPASPNTSLSTTIVVQYHKDDTCEILERLNNPLTMKKFNKIMEQVKKDYLRKVAQSALSAQDVILT